MREADSGRPTPRQASGAAAEQRALELMEAHGMHLLARNWRCRRGELDLVMRDADTVVFIEVRSRKHASHGGAAASVDHRKRQRLVLAARMFLAQHAEHAARPARFDVITFDGAAAPQWLRAAFVCES